MEREKINKFLVILLYFALIVSIGVTVFAVDISGVPVNPNTSFNGSGKVVDTGNKVIGVIQVIGIILSVGVLMILGIKYMIGSAEEKAEYKKTFVPYIIGAILVFAASALADIIYRAAQSI